MKWQQIPSVHLNDSALSVVGTPSWNNSKILAHNVMLDLPAMK